MGERPVQMPRDGAGGVTRRRHRDRPQQITRRQPERTAMRHFLSRL
jgi:hypothetical protein